MVTSKWYDWVKIVKCWVLKCQDKIYQRGFSLTKYDFLNIRFVALSLSVLNKIRYLSREISSPILYYPTLHSQYFTFELYTSSQNQRMFLNFVIGISYSSYLHNSVQIAPRIILVISWCEIFFISTLYFLGYSVEWSNLRDKRRYIYKCKISSGGRVCLVICMYP